MKNRLVRVKELLKRELGTVINREIRFEATLVTISEVDITPDLKQAHVYLSVMGTPSQKKSALAVLERNRPMLQADVSKRVILKNTPHLHFHIEDSVERGTRVLKILDELGLETAPTKEHDPEP
jgi:ribosome-binding factor A